MRNTSSPYAQIPACGVLYQMFPARQMISQLIPTTKKTGLRDSGRQCRQEAKNTRRKKPKLSNLTHPRHIIKRPTEASLGIEIPSPTQIIISTHKNLTPPTPQHPPRVSAKIFLSRPEESVQRWGITYSLHSRRRRSREFGR